MKNFILLLALLITFSGIAQNLETKIPSDAQIVVGVDGEKLLELINLDEFNSLSIVKKLLTEAKVDKIEDLGFDLNQKIYYFNQLINEKYYNTFLLYLSDSKKIKNLLDIKEEIETVNGFNFAKKNKYAISWNDKMLIITMVSETNNTYGDSNSVINNNDEPTEEVVEESAVEEITEEPIEKTKEDVSIEVVEENTEKNKNKTQKQLLKKQILSIIATNYNNSIAANNSYKSGKESKSSVYFWMKNYSNSMMDLLKRFPKKGIASYSLMPKNIIGITSVNSNLFFNKDEIKLIGEASLTDEMKTRSKKMYHSKLDCSFFKYFNQDDILAYMGYSVRMKAILDEYPKIMKEIYGSTMPKYKEEISAATDVISVLLDEKAISKLITGDALLILNDIKEEDISYTTYEYDNDYKRTKIIKTKKETLPIFTVMLGSENKEIIQKLVRLGIKYKVAEENNRILKFDKTKFKSPFDLYFVMQGDIAFITNSKSQIDKISRKQVKRNTGKHKRILRKNLLSFYINSDKIIERLPKDKFGNKNETVIALIKEDFKEMEFSYSRVKHGKFYVKQVIKTNENKDNSLKLLFNLIEQISHL